MTDFFLATTLAVVENTFKVASIKGLIKATSIDDFALLSIGPQIVVSISPKRLSSRGSRRKLCFFKVSKDLFGLQERVLGKGRRVLQYAH